MDGRATSNKFCPTDEEFEAATNERLVPFVPARVDVSNNGVSIQSTDTVWWIPEDTLEKLAKPAALVEAGVEQPLGSFLVHAAP